MNYLLVILLFLSTSAFANKVVNIYAWGGEIPKQVIQQFEQQTGIRVNFSTYDSNETMYAKLRSSPQSLYDVVLPSAYYVERMQKKGMLSPIDHSKLSNYSNVDSAFTDNDYDRGNHYSIPIIWGATGIFYNQQYIKQPPKTWLSLWSPQWREQLLLLDDSREIFALALLSLHYSPNDENPIHIQQAYQKLKQLIPNIKLFSSDGVQAVIIDEDAIIGSAWNGDALKAHAENPNIAFIYPKEGFVIWIDCLAIPVNPPHPDEAYQFINYLLSASASANIALKEGHAITNREGKKRLPKRIRNNPTVYPSHDILKRGYVQRDVREDTIALFNEYWQKLKLEF
jgi:spermidine/putrescine transport system substrate-binding protein